jgi:hypothetical protein
LKDKTYEDLKILDVKTLEYKTLSEMRAFLNRVPPSLMRLKTTTLRFIGTLGESQKLIHWLKTLDRNDTFEKEITICSQSEDRQHVVAILADLQVVRDTFFELGAKEKGSVQASIPFSEFLDRIHQLQEAASKAPLRITANSTEQVETIMKNMNEILQVREDIQMGNIDSTLTRHLLLFTQESSYQYRLTFNDKTGRIMVFLNCLIPNFRSIEKRELKSLARSVVTRISFCFLSFFFLFSHASCVFFFANRRPIQTQTASSSLRSLISSWCFSKCSRKLRRCFTLIILTTKKWSSVPMLGPSTRDCTKFRKICSCGKRGQPNCETKIHI